MGDSPGPEPSATTSAAAISRLPGMDGLPPFLKSSQRETPSAPTVQKQSADGWVLTPIMNERPDAASQAEKYQGMTRSG